MSAVTVTFLSLEDLLSLVRDLDTGPVRDLGLLESAAARPATMLFGRSAYPTVEEKAAALLHSLVNNRALMDGNKRLGWLACVVFLDLNGYAVSLDHDEAFDLVMAVADGTLDDVASIAERLSTSPGSA